MFLKLQSNKMLNMRYLQDVFQGFHEKNVVVIYLTNGNKFVEKYASENEAKSRVEEIKNLMGMGGGLSQKDSLEDFPEKGLTSQVYIAKDTGQTYYWDKETNTYITTGTAGRTGIYSYNNDLPSNVGLEQEINKTDLIKLVNPTVEYMNGSEVIAKNNVHGIIISSTNNTVKVKTTVDLTIESFKQVSRISDLPNVGSHETLYYVKETNKLYSYDNVKNKYIDYNSADQVDQKIEDNMQVYRWNGKTVGPEVISMFQEIYNKSRINPILIIDDSKNLASTSYNSLYLIGPDNTIANNHINLCPIGGNNKFITSGNSYTTIPNKNLNILVLYFNSGTETINSISMSNSSSNVDPQFYFLAINKNYQTPYVPQYPGSPTTKKYVDDIDANLQEQIDTKSRKIAMLKYGVSTWQEFIDAYEENAIIYCAALHNNNNDYRLAFLAFVTGGSNPSKAEFQYYKSSPSHSIGQQGDQVITYTLENNNNKWSTATREAYSRIKAGTGLSDSYNGNTLTLDANYSGEDIGGIIKAYEDYGTLVDNGRLKGVTKTYGQYQTSENCLFIDKGTLENVVTGKNLETADNKVTSMTNVSTDVQYPSAKAVYDSQVIQDTAISELEGQLSDEISARELADTNITTTLNNKVKEINDNVAIIASASDLVELNQSEKTLLDLIKSLQASLSSIQDQLGDVQDLLDEINGESTPANPSISDMLDDIIGENIEEPNG